MSRRRAAAALLAFAALGAACASDQERYCASVEEHQVELSEVLADGGSTGLIEAVEPLRKLAADAPPDISDEWSLVIDRIEALDEALTVAGVDSATYDAENPPADLSEEDRTRITNAASALGAEETQRALGGLEQQALDVCQTPLVL
ncbi:MAG: hypothetical protein ACR2JD_05550 [Nocardioides sp.]